MGSVRGGNNTITQSEVHGGLSGLIDVPRSRGLGLSLGLRWIRPGGGACLLVSRGWRRAVGFGCLGTSSREILCRGRELSACKLLDVMKEDGS